MLRIALVAVTLLLPLPALAIDDGCGHRTDDWCTSEKDGACGRHMTEAACRAEPSCTAMVYRGESLVACLVDKDGYPTNCPTVGCVERR